MTEVIFEIAEPSRASAWVMGIAAALVLCLGAFFAWLSFSLGHPSVALTDDGLYVDVPLYGRLIPREEMVVTDTRIVDLNTETMLSPRFRTNGIGLPGYRVGWFRLHNGDRALAALTRYDRVIYLPTTRGYSLLLSVSEPEVLLQALQD